MRSLAAELENWYARLPGVLAAFDVADFKSLNDALGHDFGDMLIEEFEQGLAGVLGGANSFVRTGGGSWQAFMPESRLVTVSDFLAGFTRTSKLMIGWHGEARKNNDVFEFDALSPARVTRAIKGLYASVHTPDELLRMSITLADECHAIQPGLLNPVSSINRRERVRWRSVECVAVDLSCPACQLRSFEWQDGDGSTYGAEGRCSTCGAEVRFRNFNREA
jgi:GGDEF domain-containing protein